MPSKRTSVSTAVYDEFYALDILLSPSLPPSPSELPDDLSDTDAPLEEPFFFPDESLGSHGRLSKSSIYADVVAAKVRLSWYTLLYITVLSENRVLRISSSAKLEVDDAKDVQVDDF